jgi:hypothetical protein
MATDFVVMESEKRRNQMKKAGIDKLLKAHADVGAITTDEVENLEEANEIVDVLKELRRLIRKYEGMVEDK